jgi:hypothetical protein
LDPDRQPPRSLAAGGVELTRRETGDRSTISIKAAEALLRTGEAPAAVPQPA